MKRILAWSCFFVCLFSFSVVVQARVDILPRKVVIEPRERSGEVTILNVFNKPGFYRLSIANYTQDENGKYSKQETPISEDFDPETMVRISPRQFQVEAGGRQKIRISARRPADLPDGEYRFHLVATRYDTAQQEADAENNSGEVMVQMKMNLGVSIPVVIRQGEVSASAEIASYQFIPPEQVENINSAPGGEMKVTITREGNAGTLGILKILQGRGDDTIRIGSIANMNVFTDINTRYVTVPLKEDPRGKGEIRIVYENDNEEVFDAVDLQL